MKVGELWKAVLIISYKGLGYQAGRHLDMKVFESGGGSYEGGELRSPH